MPMGRTWEAVDGSKCTATSLDRNRERAAMTDEDFLAAFEDCSIPKAEWTHEAHVRMAWLYLRRRPLIEVIPDVRGSIKRYNGSLGNTEGYHETITVAFLTLIDERVDRESSVETFASFSAAHPDLLDHKMSALLAYYSREVLFSREATLVFVEPDLAPLPRGPGWLISRGPWVSVGHASIGDDRTN